MTEQHEHSEYTCFPHVRGCECTNLEATLCNPYFDEDKCPTKDAPLTPNFDCPATNPDANTPCTLHYPNHSMHRAPRWRMFGPRLIEEVHQIRWA